MKLTERPLQHALKEWAIAVDALSTGETIVLLRKGGIREQKFQVKHPLVWLYPTYEHQKPDLLKPKYASQVVAVESGWHPATVTIQCCAEITEVLPIASKTQVEALQPYHIWNEKMVEERLKWKPQQPIVVLLLKVYRLASERAIDYNDAYGGCKSWIDLIEPIESDRLSPVLAESEYERRVKEIQTAIAGYKC